MSRLEKKSLERREERKERKHRCVERERWQKKVKGRAHVHSYRIHDHAEWHALIFRLLYYK